MLNRVADVLAARPDLRPDTPRGGRDARSGVQVAGRPPSSHPAPRGADADHPDPRAPPPRKGRRAERAGARRRVPARGGRGRVDLSRWRRRRVLHLQGGEGTRWGGGSRDRPVLLEVRELLPEVPKPAVSSTPRPDKSAISPRIIHPSLTPRPSGPLSRPRTGPRPTWGTGHPDADQSSGPPRTGSPPVDSSTHPHREDATPHRRLPETGTRVGPPLGRPSTSSTAGRARRMTGRRTSEP